MRLILSPIASNYTSSISLDGMVLTIDGNNFDLSIIPVGGQAEATEDSPFIGTVSREQAVIKYHYHSIKAVPDQSTDWADYTFELESGDCPCPIVWLPEPAEAPEEQVEEAGENELP